MARIQRLPLLVPVFFLSVFAACAGQDRAASARPGSYLVVLNKADSTLSVVEPNSGWSKDTVATGTAPHEAAAARDGSIAVAANYGEKEPGHTLTVYGFRERRVLDTIDLAPHERPHGIAFLDNRSTVLVTSETSRAVLEVDVQGRRVVRAMDTGAEGSHMLVISPDRQRVYTANLGSGSVSAIDLSSGRLERTVPTGKETEAIDLSPDGGELWVGNRGEDTLTVLDARTLEKLASIPCGRMPIRLKFTPDGARVLVSCATSGEIAVLDARARREIGRILIPGQDAQPIGILIEPRGRFAFVACTGAKKVAVIDLEKAVVSGEIATGNVPDGMAWTRRIAPFRFFDDPVDIDGPF